MNTLRTPLIASMALAFVVAAPARADNVVLEARLDGHQEVATGATNQRPVGDPAGRGAAFVFGIETDVTTLCYLLQAERIGELDQAPGNGRQAHIHRGVRGQNGPVVVALAWPQDGRAADCVAEDTVFEDGSRAFPLDPATGELRATAMEILLNPDRFYVNVHNAEYPAGAIRGQLADTLQP